MNEYKDDLKFTSSYFVLVLSIIFVFLVVFRLFYSNPIEFNGESILKWELGRIIFETKDWGLLMPVDSDEAHHELRWSIIIPQVLLAVFFSEGYASYFIIPILFYSLFTVLCVALYGRKLQAFLFGILLGLVISFEPMGHAMASQLNTGTYGLLYVIAAFWSLHKYIEAGGLYKIFLCALCGFFAYGANLTYLVFCVAPAIFLVVNKKDYRAALLFLVSLGMLFVVEMWVLGTISQGGADQTRLERIWTAKFGGDSGSGRVGSTLFQHVEPLKFSHFFYRWRLLPKYDFLIFIGFLMSSLFLASSVVRKAMPPGIWLCFYGAWIYGLAVSFPILGLNPIRLVLDLHSRYLALFFPLASVVVIWLGFFFVSGLSRSVKLATPTVFIFCLSSTFFLGTMTVSCLEETQDMQNRGTISGKIAKTYCKIFRYSQEQNIYPKLSAFIFRADDYYSRFNQDYLSGKVAVFGWTRMGVFRTFVRVQAPQAHFFETENGWFSIDGEDKDECVMELGQTERPSGNYRNCIGRNMEREVFN